MTKPDVYQFTTQLRKFKPRMWRNFEISSDATVAQLIYAVMIMFRIHGFELYQVCYHTSEPLESAESETDEDLMMADIMADSRGIVYTFMKYNQIGKAAQEFIDLNSRIGNQTAFKLSDLNLHKDSYLDFILGIDNSYVIRIWFTGKKKTDQDEKLPQVTAGAGYGIFEMIEEFKTFKELAKTWKNQAEMDSVELDIARTLLHCDHLDLDRFDVKTINHRIDKLMGLYQKMQEEHYRPTEAEREFLISSD
ncbi:IS1096 element passenger TnpR family protein [Fructilactobacillus frigidiflavus]|uniref:IS1096 element passenger TnpR family protein n=1 Tax=Fructilactobacillus frigidiflavus TaxID=3242688 RepID=UPI00375702D2